MIAQQAEEDIMLRLSMLLLVILCSDSAQGDQGHTIVTNLEIISNERTTVER